MRKHLLLAPIFLLTATALFAQAGSLDLTFSGNGKQMTAIGTSTSYAWTVALQPADQKILLAGSCYGNLPGGQGLTIGIVRYLTDGTLDNSFGTNGKATPGIPNRSLFPSSILVQSDGKILVAGRAGANSMDTLFLTRLTSTGFVDNSFGSGGWVFLPRYGGGSLAFQSDGKIVVSSSYVEGNGDVKTNKIDLALLRFTAGGALDNTFGSGGSVITNAGGQDYGGQVAVLADGHIVVSGSRGSDTALALRYTNTGALDPTFGVGGIAVITVGNPPQHCSGGGLAIQSDGKIVLSGQYQTTGNELDVLVVRLNANGTLDNTFAGNGKRGVSFHANSGAVGVAMGGSGKIVVGVAVYDNPGHYGACRLLSDGSLDPDYGTGGITSFTWSGGQIVDAYAMARQNDGQLLVAGSVNDEFGIMRIRGSGTNPTAIRDSAMAAAGGNKFLSPSSSTGVRLFPNPATSQLQVTGLPAETPVLLTVTDAAGTPVLRQRTAGDNVLLDISRLAPGAYVLTITASNSRKSLTFVKTAR
jgi:uncharacterized delta-60 repeat protein